MKDLYKELSEYTNRQLELVTQRCQTAPVELSWQWEDYKDDPLRYYRESDLYIFDLTMYQTHLYDRKFYDWYREKIRTYGWRTMLDFGGGIGEYTIVAADEGLDTEFLEVKDGKTLDYAKWRFKKYNINPTIRFEDYKIDKDFDFIMIMDVLEHMEDPEPVIKQLAEHTEFVFANPNEVHYNWMYPQHISKYNLNTYFNNVESYLWKRR